MASELKIYQKKRNLIVGGLSLALLCVGLIWLLITGPNPDSVFFLFRSPNNFYPIVICGLAFFLYLIHYAVRRLLHPKPLVILSREGVVVDGFAGPFCASWDELSGYALHKTSIYVLHLKDPQDFIARQAAGRPRQSATALLEKFGSPLLIEPSMLDIDRPTLQNYLNQHLQELKK